VAPEKIALSDTTRKNSVQVFRNAGNPAIHVQHIWVITCLARLSLLPSIFRPTYKASWFLGDGAYVFHFVAIPAHSFVFEFYAGKCGKKRRNKRLC
jgi:hypothetical protein